MRFVHRALSAAAMLVASYTLALADTIVVGGKGFTEQYIMAELTSQLLRAKGFDVDTRSGMDSAPLRAAQESGQIDVYWEYTGTSLITYNKVKDVLTPGETYAKVKELDAKKGLVWLEPSKVNSTWALAIQPNDASTKNIATISDLAALVGKGTRMKFGCDAEFYARPDGLAPLESKYKFRFGRENVIRLDDGLIIPTLENGQVDVAQVISTDGRIARFKLVVLKDDLNYFPPYAMTPVIRQETLTRHPELSAILNALSKKLDDASMAALNAEVDLNKKPVGEVATTFLKANKL